MFIVFLLFIMGWSTPVWAEAMRPFWHYSADQSQGGANLTVTLAFGSTAPHRLTLAPAVMPFVHQIEVQRERGYQSVKLKDGSLALSTCPKLGCVVRYVFNLEAAAKTLGERGTVTKEGAVYLASPDAFLLHPEGEEARPTQGIELHLKARGPWTFACGLPLKAGADGSNYLTNAAELESMAPCVLGPLHRQSLPATGGFVELLLAPSVSSQETGVTAWVRAATAAVSAYFGRLPVAHSMVFLSADGGGGGVTYGNGGATILIPVDPRASASDLMNDWVMTHELVHTAMPVLPREHHWVEEGLATYVEPVARLRAGQLSASQVFKDMLEGMPQGLAEAGDKGLDFTPTWGRTYWGGALFFLLADCELRQRSGGRFGLEVALRGILEHGGNIAVQWPLSEVIRVGDQATGFPVLRQLYDKMRASAWAPDLGRLWADLGVSLVQGELRFDDKARLAYVRRGLISGGAVAPKPPAE